MADVLKAATELCPLLVNLEIRPAHGQNVINAAVSFAFKCKRLVGFKVTGASSPELLRHLASQESLRHVGILLDEEMVADLPAIITPTSLRYPFPSLDTIVVHTPNMPSTTTLIRLMGRCRLRLIFFTYTAGAATTAELLDLFRALHDHCSPTSLQEMIIQCAKGGVINAHDYTLALDVLEPVLVFSNLRTFRLAIPMYCILNDYDLVQIADHWPLMLDLRFLDGWKWIDYPEVTWAGVAYVAWRCPMLYELVLAVDMTVENVEETTSREGFRPNNHLRSLNLLDSPMHEPQACARAAHAFAPSLYEFCGHGRVEEQGDAEGDQEQRLPEQDPMAFYLTVNDLLKKLQKQQCDGGVDSEGGT